MKLNSGYMLREIAGEYILVPVGANDGRASLIQLNELGAFILSHLDGSKTAEDIADDIIGEFEADKQTVLADVNSFIDSMRELKVII